MAKVIMLLIKFLLAALAVGLIFLAAYAGMLHNYLIYFLTLSAVLMVITLVVAAFKKSLFGKVLPELSLPKFVLVSAFRNATWVLMGVCIHLALIPIQFSSTELSSVHIWVWGSVIVLCVLDWIPRKRVGVALNTVLAVYFCFLAFQLFQSYAPIDNDDAISLNALSEKDLYVFQGGNSALFNHHHFAGAQKYALDLIAPSDGPLPSKSVTELNQYETFGSPVFSPVQGTVVRAENALPDQQIGETDLKNLLGNHVVIQLSSEVFVMMAHLQLGSVKVSIGDDVTVGQVVGNIGNSGNTSQPHLHIQAMTKANFLAENNRPLPIQLVMNSGLKKGYMRNDVIEGLSGQ